MRTEHLDFITFCVGSLSDSFHKNASQVYGALKSNIFHGFIDCHKDGRDK